jgi:hypothetical protein
MSERGGVSISNVIGVAVIATAAYYVWSNGLVGGTSGPESHNDVIVYVSKRCGTPCDAMIAAIRAESVDFYTVDVDQDYENAEELRDKLDAIGFRQKIYRLPVVDMYGEVLPVPSVADVRDRLR